MKRLLLAGLLLLWASAAVAAPWWEVHFTEQRSNTNSAYEQAIYDFIMQANSSVWITSYTWGNSSHNKMVEALNAQYARGLDVRVIGDNTSAFNSYMDAYEKRTDAAAPDADNLQHNKFIVLDYNTANAKVMTGSTNWTDPAYATQNNDIIAINNRNIANCYGREFLELWTGNFRSGPTDVKDYTVNGHTVNLYFAPEDDPGQTYLANLLRNAQHSIFFLSFNHRLSDLMNRAVDLKNRGGIAEGAYESVYGDMLTQYMAAGIDIRQDANTDHLHNKLYIVDLATVATGSMNHSNISSSYTDENELFIHDFRLAREYMQYFHFCYDQASPQVATPTHEDNAPAIVTNLGAVDTPNDTGQSITVSWTGVGDADLAGYYVFISTTPIGSVQDLIPEKFVQGATSTTVTTYNQDDPISNNTDYYIAVSSVDWRGNENYNCPTAGPVQASGVITGSRPSGTIDFADTASHIAGEPSTLVAVIHNDTTAVSAIATITISFGDPSAGFSFTPAAAGGQAPPAGWVVAAVTDTTITYRALMAGDQIAADGSETFTITVTNPVNAGTSNAITLGVVAANGEVTTGVTLSAGLITIAPSAVPLFTLAWGAGSSQRGGNNATLAVAMHNEAGAGTSIREVTFSLGAGNAAFTARGSDVQVAPAGWTVSGSGNTLTFTASDTAHYLAAGDTLALTLAVINPGISRASDAITATTTDRSGMQVPGVTVGSLTVQATDGIVFNEFMYNPVGSDVLFEYIELYNRTPVTVELGGWQVSAGGAVTTLPAGTTLDAYKFIVIASTLSRGTAGDEFYESYSSRYGNRDGIWLMDPATPGENYQAIDGTDFDLNDDADFLTLTSNDNTFTVTVRYNDALNEWGGADGTGASLEKIDPSIDDVGIVELDGPNWGAQQMTATYPDGTPGVTNSIAVSQVPPVTGLAVRSVTENSVTLAWSPLTGFATFAGYHVYYATASPVTSGAPVWNAVQDPNLALMATGRTTITGLAANTTYYFRIIAQSTLSGLGDVSSADEVSTLTTVTTEVTVNYLYDGVRYVTTYDGSAILRDVGTTVNLRLAAAPANPASVMVWYDVGADPDGSATGNSSDRVAYAAGNGVTWDAVIPGNDAEISDGAGVRFLVQVDGIPYFNNGLPWKYTVDGGISASFTDLAAAGAGYGRIELRWTPVTNVPDFGQYRVYYTAGSETLSILSPSWDAVDDVMLAYSTTGATVVSGLQPGGTYRFRIVAVDRYGNESDLATSNEATGTAKHGTVIITEFAPEGDTLSSALPWVELYCVEGTQDMSGWNLTDLNGNTVPVGAVVMNAGGYRVVYLTDSTFFAGDGVLALDADMDTANGSYADAVIWTDGNGVFSAADAADVRALGVGNWEYSSSYVAATPWISEYFSVPYTAGGFYSLVRAEIDGYRDQNTRTDWRLQYVPSKGLTNGVSTVALQSFTDGYRSAYPDGYTYFQDTAVTAVFGFGTAPADSSDVRLYYNYDLVPTGDPAGADSWVLLAPQGDLYTWGGTFPGTGNPAANSGRRVNFIVAADGVPFYRDNVPGVAWSYRLDGAVPPAAGGFSVQGTTQSAAVTAWSPVAVIDDFATYRVYYAVAPGPVTTASAYVDKATVSELQYRTTAGAVISGLTAGQTYVLAVAAVDARGNAGALSGMDTAAILPSLSVTSLSVGDTAGNRVTGGFAGSDRLRGTDLQVEVWFSEAPAATPVLWWDGMAAPDGPGGSGTDRSLTMTAGSDVRQWTATIPDTDASVVNDTTLQLVFSVNTTVVRNGSVTFKVRIDTTAAPLSRPAGFSVVGTLAGGATLSWTPVAASADFTSYRVYYGAAPGPLSAGSAYVDKSAYAALGTVTTGGVTVTGLNFGDTYVFAVAAADALGNITALSNLDTGLTLVSQTVTTLQLADTAGNTVTATFDGSQALRHADVQVSIVLAENAADTPVVWFDVGAVPDGPGGANGADRSVTMTRTGDAKNWAATVPYTDGEIVNGATVQLIIFTSGAALKASGQPWQYRVDGQAGGAPALVSTASDVNSTTVILSWTPVSVTDFGAYVVYYARAASVTKSDSQWTQVKDAQLAAMGTSGTSVRGLAASDTYTFAVAWRDRVGNESVLSNTLSRLTNAMVPADDPASDGWNIAHRLDGTEALRDTDITITMLLASPPTAANSAWIYYDVGGYPDGPGGSNSEERRIALVDSPDNDPHTWTAVIPGSDPEIADGALVRYVGAADGFILTNGGNPYAFRIDSSAPAAAGSPGLIDNGSSLLVTWAAVSAADFAEYRVYYATAWPARAGLVRGRAADVSLGSAGTSGTTLSGLDPALNYFVNIATVDAVGNERLLADDLVLYRRVPGAAAALAYAAGAATGSGEVYPGLAWPVAVRVTDAAGLPVPGTAVNFAVTAGAGTLAATAAVTGLDGVARVTLTAGAPAAATVVRATAGVLAPVDISVLATQPPPAALRLLVPAGATADDTVTVTVEALAADGTVDAGWQGSVTLAAAENGVQAGTLRGMSMQTLVSGRGTWLLGNSEAEAVTLTATSVTLNPAGTAAALTFAAGAPAQLRLTAPATATAGSPASVSVTVYDAGGNRCLTDAATAVTVTAGGNAYVSLAGPQRVTGGVLALTVHDLTAETVTVQAAAAGLPPAVAQVAFMPAAAVKAVATPWLTVPAGETAAVTVDIRDAYGNRVTGDSGRAVGLQVSGTAQVLSSTPTQAGTARLVITDAFAGDVVLTPVAAGLTAVGGTAHFYAGTDTLSAASALVCDAAAYSATAGSARQVTVRVVDARGQTDITDNGRSITLATAGAAQAAVAVVTTVDGLAVFTVTDTRAESVLLTATAAGLRSGTATLTVAPAAAAAVRATAPASVACNAAAAVALALTDAYGNVLSTDHTSLAALVAARGTVGNAGPLSAGQRTLTITTPQAGPLAVVPRIGALAGETLAIDVLSGAPVCVAALAADTVLLNAASPLVLEVQDAGGNRVATDNGRQVMLLLGGNATSPAQAGAYTVAGRIITTITGLGAGDITVYPMATGLNTLSDTLRVVAPPPAPVPAQVVAVCGAGAISIDDTASVRVEVRDAGGLLLTSDMTTVVRLAAPAGVRVVPAQQAVSGGMATFAVGTDSVGSITLTPAAGTLGATGTALDVRPGVPVAVRLTGPATAIAGGAPATLAVRVEDRAGNVCDGAWTVALAAAGNATVPASVTTAAGLATAAVQDAVAETVTVTATAAGMGGGSATVQFVPATPQQLTLTLPAAAAFGSTVPVSVTVRDGAGNPVAVTGSVALTVDAGSVTPAVLTFSGATATGSVSFTQTGALQLRAAWTTLAATATVQVQVPPQAAATIAAAANVTVKLPAGVIGDSCVLDVRTGADAAAGLSLGGIVGEPVEFFLYDATGDTVTGNFAALVTVEVAYADADQNGIVDGTAVAEQTLQLCRWENGAWVVVNDGGRNGADAVRNVVVADLRHFSQYAIRVSADTGATGGEIVAYPNPWKSTYASERIVWANVPTGVPVRLEIYTIGGEKVIDGELALGANQRLEWDLRNGGGGMVASGIYIYRITGGGVEKIGKIAVIR